MTNEDFYYERVVLQTKGNTNNFHIGYEVTELGKCEHYPTNQFGDYILTNAFPGLNRPEIERYLKMHKAIIPKERMTSTSIELIEKQGILFADTSFFSLENIIHRSIIDDREVKE
ncbi:MAG: hypothetical protein PF542_04130 [Nanoarchaeota archaeon]|jgi:hypothetical protein|nr:hypothetical protein [Nanoarchaeota archaeon]